MKSLFIGGPADGKHMDVADGLEQVKIAPPMPALERFTHANAMPKNTTVEDFPYYAGRLRNHRGESFRVFHTRDIDDVVNALIDGYRQPLQHVDHLAAELETATHERSVLAKAIRNAAVKAGICRADAPLTGPHLLMLRDDLAEVAREKPAGEPVAWRHSLTHSLHDLEGEVELADGNEWAEPLYTEQPVPSDAFALLDIWKTWLGPDRESCSEYDKPLWDRIDAVLAGKEPKHD